MNKLVICTTGTSIANACSSQRDLLRQPKAWDDDAEPLRREISEFLRRPENDLRQQSVRRAICAEMNSLDRLEIKSSDRVVLLTSDTAQGRVCAEMIKKVIVEAYSLSNGQVEIRMVEGLQVHSARKLREEGLKNLIKILLDDYLTKGEIRYAYDIILNATGGFKGTVPFLTILGMLYGKRTVYTFEFANELITLPPLPFSFDLGLYNRVKPALDLLDNEIAVPEQTFLSKVVGYVPTERDLFMTFTEPFDEGRVTISPLASCLLRIDTKKTLFVSERVMDILKGSKGTHKIHLERMLSKSIDPLWRNSHLDTWNVTDLLVIKERNGERIAGFNKGGSFHVTHAFGEHDDYKRILGDYWKKDFLGVKFLPWQPSDDVAADEKNSDAVAEERDKLIVESRELKTKSARLHDELIELQLKEEEHKSAEKKLEALLHERDLELTRLNEKLITLQATVQALEQQTLSLKNDMEKKSKPGNWSLTQFVRALLKRRA